MARRPQTPSPASAGVSLKGFYRHFSVAKSVAFVKLALERAGLSERDLAPYQERLLGDLDEPLDEEALVATLAYWDYNIPRLTKRGRSFRKGIPAKPRIDLIVEITSKDNLKVEWFPQGWAPYSNEPLADTDFRWWQRYENRDAGYHTRPSNELLFLHSVEPAVRGIGRQERHLVTAVLDHVLLGACASAIDLLKSRLKPHFDIRMVSDVFVEWEGEEAISLHSYETTSAQIVRWEIDSPEEREKASELAELNEMESRMGFSEAALLEARDFETARVRPTGPAPEPYTLPDRLARELKKRGFAATKGKVMRALQLIDRHRTPSNVVPLRQA